jgi:biopolymer transport protein ExbB
VIVSRLDAFAYELHTFVSMGQPLSAPDTSSASTVRPMPVRPAAA